MRGGVYIGVWFVAFWFWCNAAGWPWRHKVLVGVGVKTWDVCVLDGVPIVLGVRHKMDCSEAQIGTLFQYLVDICGIFV